MLARVELYTKFSAIDERFEALRTLNDVSSFFPK